MPSEFEDSYDDLDITEALNEIDPVHKAVLDTPVSDLMATDPLLVEADSSVVTAVEAMNTHHTGCVLVRQAGNLVGIFTERDVLRKVIFRDGNRDWKVEAVMTKDPETLPPTASVAFALNKMSVDGYRHIPVVDRNGKPIGVLSIRDIVNFLVDFFPSDVLNLPSTPDQAIPKYEHGG